MDARVPILTLVVSASLASAQAQFPVVFVANNGNLEGSVSTMVIHSSGSVGFLDRVITGTRSSLSQPCPGCNTSAIDITPNGRFLATAHSAGDGGENTTVYEVAHDGSLTVVEELVLAQGGLDLKWLSNDLLAVPLTDLSIPNTIRLYRLNGDNELVFVEAADSGSFLTSLALHPSGRWLYANDSFDRLVRVFDTAGGTLELVQTLSIPIYGTSLEVSPDGGALYASGGISGGGNAFAGYAIDPVAGTLTALPGSPFTSPGASPKGFAFSGDGEHMYVSHGTDATIRAFSRDGTGVPTSTGFSFDVGLQGALREMVGYQQFIYALDETTAIDGVRGVYAMPIGANGDLSIFPDAPIDTQGISPNDLVVWGGPRGCTPADLAPPFRVLDLADLSAFVAAFIAGGPDADLAEPVGVFDLADVQGFVMSFLTGCP